MSDLIQSYHQLLFFLVPSVIIVFVVVLSCQKEIDPEEHAQSITEFVNSLSYEPNALLEVQNIQGASLKSVKDSVPTSRQLVSDDLVVCREVTYNLKQNAEQVAIIRPTNGIIWPGALVKINKGLLNGLPEPITLKPSPATLFIDLPGMVDPIIVKEPAHSNTMMEINKALDKWNNTQAANGYTISSNSSYQVATSFSSTQLALDLGLNVNWASVEFSSQLNHVSTQTKKVAMMTFKQVFYTVTFDTPSKSGIVFDTSVDLGQIRSTFSNAEPPGYVHSVSYGRIIMFRMTTSESATSTEVQAAMQYGAKKISVSGDVRTKYENILKNSSIEVITIGGNAKVTSYAIAAGKISDLDTILTGKNAVYSKDNPGVPIAYTVKFLKDNKVAKMGFTTDYTAKDCTISKKGTLTINHEAPYWIKVFIVYDTYDGKHIYYVKENIPQGQKYYYTIPGGSKNIIIHAQTQVGSYSIFRKEFVFPENVCFRTTRHQVDPGYDDC